MKKQFNVLAKNVQNAFSSLSLFYPDSESEILPNPEYRQFIQLLKDLLNSIQKETFFFAESATLENTQSVYLHQSFQGHPDAIEKWNQLADFLEKQNFTYWLDTILLEILVQKGILRLDETQSQHADFEFWIRHACRISEMVEPSIAKYFSLLKGDLLIEQLSRILPWEKKLCQQSSVFNKLTGSVEESQNLLQVYPQLDPLHAGRVFRYGEGLFLPEKGFPVRDLKQFYGFEGVRHFFKRFFDRFSQGQSNIPLLITSLPGLGKTQLTLSHVLSYPKMTLILCDPMELNKPLEKVFQLLSKRSDRQFVLFFDDIDTRQMDWYYFRTRIGGISNLPSNVTLVAASNYEFPANILSRGRGYNFPIFDERHCMDMIRDFLINRMKMQNPPENLVLVMAADYVELFAQKEFEDLSPRTLVRYLEGYEKNQKKRMDMLDYSRQEVLAKPDATVFLDENIRLLRALYGEAGIDALREQYIQKQGL